MADIGTYIAETGLSARGVIERIHIASNRKNKTSLNVKQRNRYFLLFLAKILLMSCIVYSLTHYVQVRLFRHKEIRDTL